MRVWTALAALLCCATLSAGEGDSLLVSKCCPEDGYMDLANKECLKESNTTNARVRFGPPFWVPEWLRAERDIEVNYNGINWLLAAGQHLPQVFLDAEEQLVRRLLTIDADARRFVLEPFGDGVDARTVAKQQVCFDITRDSRRRFVVVTWLRHVMLYKCCAEGAQLNARLQCVSPDAPLRSLESPNGALLQPLNATPWLPARLRDAVQAADVYYDVLRGIPGFEYTVVDADDPTAWRMLFPRPRDGWQQAMWVRAGGGMVGAGFAFCFDTTEAKSRLPARVVVAQVARVSKCCRLGEQLEPREMQCVARHDMEVVMRNMELLGPDDPSSYWLPRYLIAEGVPVPVQYRFDWGDWHARLLFPADRTQVVRFPDRPAAACVRLRKPSGRVREVCTSNFCFDALAGGLAPQVLAVSDFDRSDIVTVKKCCYQGQMLHEESGTFGASPKIRCQQDASEDWSPENSSLAGELNAERLYVGQPLAECLDQAFTLVDEAPARELDMLRSAETNRFVFRFHCKDLLRRHEGGPARDVLAFCELPANARQVEQVRSGIEIF